MCLDVVLNNPPINVLFPLTNTPCHLLLYTNSGFPGTSWWTRSAHHTGIKLFMFYISPQLVQGALLAHRYVSTTKAGTKEEVTPHYTMGWRNLTSMLDNILLTIGYPLLFPHSSRCFIKVLKSLLSVKILQFCQQGPVQWVKTLSLTSVMIGSQKY